MSTNLIADLEQFTREMAKYDERQVVKTVPVVPSEEVYRLRTTLIHEEVEETLLAMDLLQNDIEGLEHGNYPECSIPERLAAIADGIADSIVVLIGTALAYGIPLQKVWDEVHRSNMDKVTVEPCPNCESLRKGYERYVPGTCEQCNGTNRIPIQPKIREDGKILKPDGWRPPQIQQIIEEAMK